MITAFFADLRKEVAIEAGETSAARVWNVDISDAASGSFVDCAAITFNPIEETQPLFAVDGNHGDLARILAVGAGANLQHDLLAGGLFEEAVNVILRVQFTAIHRENVVAHLGVDAGLREWSLHPWIPVFSVVDFRESVAAVLQAVVGAEQTSLYLFNLRLFAAAHEHVADGHFSEALLKQIGEFFARGDAL
jgi:hypothetical protein